MNNTTEKLTNLEIYQFNQKYNALGKVTSLFMIIALIGAILFTSDLDWGIWLIWLGLIGMLPMLLFTMVGAVFVRLFK